MSKPLKILVWNKVVFKARNTFYNLWKFRWYRFSRYGAPSGQTDRHTDRNSNIRYLCLDMYLLRYKHVFKITDRYFNFICICNHMSWIYSEWIRTLRKLWRESHTNFESITRAGGLVYVLGSWTIGSILLGQPLLGNQTKTNLWERATARSVVMIASEIKEIRKLAWRLHINCDVEGTGKSSHC